MAGNKAEDKAKTMMSALKEAKMLRGAEGNRTSGEPVGLSPSYYKLSF